MRMSERQHRAAAKALIKACGGLLEAAEACRVNKSSLSNYETGGPDGSAYMPADVIDDLEDYCGESIYSERMRRASHGPVPSADLQGDALALTASAVSLSQTAHEALSNGIIEDHERGPLNTSLDAAESLIAGIRSAVNDERAALRRVS